MVLCWDVCGTLLLATLFLFSPDCFQNCVCVFLFAISSNLNFFPLTIRLIPEFVNLTWHKLYSCWILNLASYWKTKNWNCVFNFKFSFQFFTTKPLPCDPSSLPKYVPSKEYDAKLRNEEARRYAIWWLLSYQYFF